MGVSRLRQFVIACQSADHIDMFGALLGLDAPFVDLEVANFGLTNAVFALGDQFLEIVVPVEPNTPAQRFINRGGPGGYMAIFQTDDLASARQRFDDLGVRRVLDMDRTAISATHLHPSDTGGAILSIDEPRPAASWEWAGPDWPRRSAVGRLLGTDIEARDPAAMAHRWSDILALPVEADSEHHLIRLEEGPLRFVEGKRERIIAVRLTLPDPDRTLARAADFDLHISGRTITFCGLQLIIEN